ncbi:unnamed protein product [Brugia pahangi]|uniref:Secreted protein n=1 Tax=Brugia pahangi TaxID=6280 RepID=A0A0N4TJI6_BRUPA|nr:unnamed protein product [Brugia pahangi]
MYWMAMTVMMVAVVVFRSANFSRRIDNYNSNVKEAHRGVCHKIKSTNGALPPEVLSTLYSLTFLLWLDIDVKQAAGAVR